jgi:hypothetical protein
MMTIGTFRGILQRIGMLEGLKQKHICENHELMLNGDCLAADCEWSEKANHELQSLLCTYILTEEDYQ